MFDLTTTDFASEDTAQYTLLEAIDSERGYKKNEYDTVQGVVFDFAKLMMIV